MINFVLLFDFTYVREYHEYNNVNVVYRVRFRPTNKFMYITCVYHKNEKQYDINMLVMLLYYQVCEWEQTVKRYTPNNKINLSFQQWCLWKRQVTTLSKVMDIYYSFFVGCKVLYSHTYHCLCMNMKEVGLCHEILSYVSQLFSTYDMSFKVTKINSTDYYIDTQVYVEPIIGKHIYCTLKYVIGDTILNMDELQLLLISNVGL